VNKNFFMSSGFHYTKFLTKILNINFIEGNSVLRMVFSFYFLNFDDKTENFCLKSSENHYFLAEIKI